MSKTQEIPTWPECCYSDDYWALKKFDAAEIQERQTCNDFYNRQIQGISQEEIWMLILATPRWEDLFFLYSEVIEEIKAFKIGFDYGMLCASSGKAKP